MALALLAVAVRVPGISRPLLGQFATKNAIYAMIARNWASGRAPFWLPTVDCLAAGDRSWHLLEIPVAAYLAGEGWAICGGSLDVWGRAVSVAFSAAGVAVLYVLVRRWHGERAARVAALVLALSPVSILCGQSFMLESSAVLFMLLAIWSVENWLVTFRWWWWILATLSVALMLCTKIYLAVMLLPLVVCPSSMDRYKKGGWGRSWPHSMTPFPIDSAGQQCPGSLSTGASPRQCLPAKFARYRGSAPATSFFAPQHKADIALRLGGCAAMAILGAAPAVFWFFTVSHISSPENPLSAHVYYSLSRSAEVNSVPSPLLFKADFYLQIFKSLAGAGLTPLGLLLALIGALDCSSRRHAFWLAALGVLILVLPGKFFELRYYILILVPALAVLAGLGWQTMAARLPAAGFCGVACLLLGLGCSLGLVAGPAWNTPAEDRAVPAAAAAVRALSNIGEPVATLHGTAPDLLYYCDRPGWALSVNDRRLAETLAACRRQGARWLVVTDMASLPGKPAAEVIASLHAARAGEDYCIYHLPTAAGRLARRKIR